MKNPSDFSDDCFLRDDLGQATGLEEQINVIGLDSMRFGTQKIRPMNSLQSIQKDLSKQEEMQRPDVNYMLNDNA